MADSQDNTYVIDSESGAEMARLLDQDHMMTEAMGTFLPYAQAFEQAERVLDVACGPGGWAMEVAFRYPELDVTGIDISTTMIQYANAQARVQGLDNLTFQVMNVLHPLAFADDSFDVVNARFMVSFLSAATWPVVVKELARVLRPGGVLTLTEGDDSGISNSPALERYKRLVYRAFLIEGRSLEPEGRHLGITPMLGRFLSQAGLHQLGERAYILNSSYGSKAYASNYKNFQYFLKLVQPFLCKLQVATQEELDALYEQAMVEMLNPDYRSLTYLYSVWSVKPAP